MQAGGTYKVEDRFLQLEAVDYLQIRHDRGGQLQCQGLWGVR